MRLLESVCPWLGTAALLLGCESRLLCESSGLADECSAADESTGSLDSDDADEHGEGGDAPGAVEQLQLRTEAIKQFQFTWAAAADADLYRLFERAKPQASYELVGENASATAMTLTVPLFRRMHARYFVRACNEFGCRDSDVVDVEGSLAEAVGYVKPANAQIGDLFGWSVALSADGNTLAVGASNESSRATGIDGDASDDSAPSAGAVYVFARDLDGQWVQQAYVKASNAHADDCFGRTVALSSDGNTLAVGALREDGGATGIDGAQGDLLAPRSGAVYVYSRDESHAWAQSAYVKASNTDSGDRFGTSVALSGDGSTLAVGAIYEDSSATGIDGDQGDNAAFGAGAVYVFAREFAGEWSQQAYVKASNTEQDGPGGDPSGEAIWGDSFGWTVALSGDGSTLAVGADYERSDGDGVGADPSDNSAFGAGAVYVFTRSPAQQWSQHAYLKAQHSDAHDRFGWSLALSEDGRTLAVGAVAEAGKVPGIDGDQTDNSAPGAGAVYVYTRDELEGWSQQAYVKAANAEADDAFGRSVALSSDGDTLVVGALDEDDSAVGIAEQPSGGTAHGAGAAYVFVRDPAGAWTQESFVKASNTDAGDAFGWALALSADGRTLAVAAPNEASKADGVGGQQTNDEAPDAGAVYLY